MCLFHTVGLLETPAHDLHRSAPSGDLRTYTLVLSRYHEAQWFSSIHPIRMTPRLSGLHPDPVCTSLQCRCSRLLGAPIPLPQHICRSSSEACISPYY